ncbi:MAG: CsbD family protein [Pseudomonadota bacterium]|nr:general stress protein CsbD [Pseudomonadales bacterium]MDY6919230.1 CsbD family protein [Pseudomonadota bacterium]
MSNDVMEGKWKQVKGKLRENWGKLTDDDVEQVDGSNDRLVGMLQEKYGYAKEEAEKQVRKLLDSVS